jgi:hypothetical protein
MLNDFSKIRLKYSRVKLTIFAVISLCFAIGQLDIILESVLQGYFPIHVIPATLLFILCIDIVWHTTKKLRGEMTVISIIDGEFVVDALYDYYSCPLKNTTNIWIVVPAHMQIQLLFSERLRPSLKSLSPVSWLYWMLNKDKIGISTLLLEATTLELEIFKQAFQSLRQQVIAKT